MNQHEIENLLIEHVKPLFRADRSIKPTTRPCGDLGICDEDLWDVLDFAIGEIGLQKPAPTEPASIAIPHSDLTFSDLAKWLIDRQAPQG